MLLLGIAERQIHIKFGQKQRPERNAKPLPINIQTIGDWIRVSRAAKNITSGHVAAKMGVADAVVRSWEGGTSFPDNQQLSILEVVLGIGSRMASLWFSNLGFKA